MRHKISISVPAIVAFTLFIFGIVSVSYYYLAVVNGEFKIIAPAPTTGAYLLGFFILAVFAFIFLKRRVR
jgi:hypothetical protein